ncbi:hypothetical protein [Rhodococcus sp. (in: high G+C Gram-positive bacteria)]|uniref:hypothetical protein n=1 Tax=Rhodococcus sp. TaxID=1831 RepID=UPI001A2F5E40|nr:hypothetical protein [Rhodococcus sp. (in: high G+C Gram-positive bacteria)]MBJ7481769.1 hypothetical protein [Rhodococcus sp. (in: high G+C Gram-positive bacteria)]
MAPRKDTRPYIKVTLDMPDHPKYAGLTRAQKFLVIEGWIHCAKYKTDGHMDIHVWRKFGTKKDRFLFEEVGIVKMDSDEAGANFVDYLEHQTSRAEQEAKQDQARSAGKKGGAAKAAKTSETGSEPVAERYRPASVPFSGSLAEEEVEVRKEPTYVGSSTHLSDAKAKPRGVRAIADHLNGKAHSPEAHIIAKAYSESCPSPVPGDVVSKIAQAVDGCLKSGVGREQIEAGIQDWAASPMTAPSMIPGFVHKSANRAATPATTPTSKSDEKVQGFLAFANPNTRKELA